MSPAVMPTRILVVGGGGREHALAWKLSDEPGVNLVIVAPGQRRDRRAAAGPVRRGPGPPTTAAIVEVARANAVELAVIGPEQPLADGLADALAGGRRADVRADPPRPPGSRPPRRSATRWPRRPACAMADGARLPVAGRGHGGARATFAGSGRGFVIKEDGLAAGKGVSVHGPRDAAAIAPYLERLFRAGPDRVVLIEERLTGREASVIALSDGRDVVALPAARDHKRLRDGDDGPNTGGMGAYSPLADLPESLRVERPARVHRPILAELARRGTPFVGALYAGLMLTADGPELLECNARFGDPETQVVLPRLAVALGPLLLAAARGALGPVAAAHGGVAPVLPGAAVGIVLAGGGYPDAPRRGDRDQRPRRGRAEGRLVFHAGTRRAPTARSRRTAAGSSRSWAGAQTSPPPATRRAAPPTRSRSTGLQRRHDIGVGRRRRVGAVADDPALHAARDGRDLDRAGALRGDAPGRDRRRPGPGRPRSRPGRTRSPRSRRGRASTSPASPRSSRRPTTTSSRS